jgi:mRNA-degrading endonuclease RelE of RelBE toxin-antitoxin system
MGEYWRYRVGNIQVICNIADGQLAILVIEIGNLREVYRRMKFSKEETHRRQSKNSGD